MVFDRRVVPPGRRRNALPLGAGRSEDSFADEFRLPMNLYAVQVDIVWEDKAANFAKVAALLSSTRPEAGSLVVLPEMFATGFSMNLGVTKQTPDREDETFLAALAREHRVFVIGGVVSEASRMLGRNQAVAFSPDGSLIARYTKIHPFSLG